MSAAPAGRYAAVEGHYDEMALPSGGLRPSWQRLMEAFRALGHADLAGRWGQANRLIQENGVTYNVYGDPRGIHRPWQLDPIPLLIEGPEWGRLAAAVEQRALLLDRLLADVYGPRRLLHEGRLPPELVLANPGFLRPCHGIRVRGDRFLNLYSADLARSPDGQWWVIADRTQAPSGAGYALENRVVMSRILPELFREFHVRRLAGYFQAYHDALMALAPGRDNPRVVLLTPGPYNETYFEHAYLARYLNVTLAEGADLTVRDERVWLKTLSGLLRVDVIVRRQDDSFCDPLELYGASALGVPGLVQAVRAGNVAVANALGSGVLETAATMAFLPGLCRELLGEELAMPSVATWWCGHEPERSYVVAHLDRLVIKPTFPTPGEDVVFPAELARAEREALLARLEATPHRFVAQERVALSTAPTGQAEGPVPRHVVLRVYAVATDDGFSVMPGGLTRVSTAADSLVVSSQKGGGSKDTWVLADAPAPYRSLMDRVHRPADVVRGSFALPSRVADNLFWLGRTSERAEAMLRLLRCALRRLADEPLRPADAPRPDALVLLDRLGGLPALEGGEEAGLEARVLAACFDREQPVSLAASVIELHRIAWLVRDRISMDAWRVLSGLDRDFIEPELHPALRVSGALELLDRTLMALSAFSGLVGEGMTRGLGWRFLDIGKRIERGIQMVELLGAGLADVDEEDSRRLENLLEVGMSRMTYRSRYLTSLQLPLVVDLLLVDEANPRSVAHQLACLEDRFGVLPRGPREEVGALLERIRQTPLESLVEREPDTDRRPRLDALLAALSEGLPALSERLNHVYLSHAIPRRVGMESGP